MRRVALLTASVNDDVNAIRSASAWVCISAAFAAAFVSSVHFLKTGSWLVSVLRAFSTFLSFFFVAAAPLDVEEEDDEGERRRCLPT